VHRKEKLTIESSNLRFNKLAEDSPELRELIVGSNVLILPSREEHNAFYTGTLDILDHMKESEGDLAIDILSTDDEYRELGLHGADIWLGTFIVKSIVVPIFVGLITSYIYDKVKAKKDDHVSIKIIVEDKDGESKAVSFDGKVEDFNKAVDAINEIADE